MKASTVIQSFSSRAFVIYAVLLVFLPNIINFLFGDGSGDMAPTADGILLGILCAWTMGFLRNPCNRAIAHLWMSWFFVGCFNSISSFYFIGNAYRPVFGAAEVIYFSFLLAFLIAMVSVEKITGAKRSEQTIGDVRGSKWIRLILIIAAAAWVSSLVASVGGVPVLTGMDITDDIYSTSYGPLYGYALVVPVASLIFVIKALRGPKIGALAAAIAIALCIAAAIDGKRFLLIVIFLSGCFISFRLLGPKKSKKLAVLFVLSGACAYLAILALRQGFNFSRYSDGLIALSYTTGVEFRDFSIATASHQPGTIANYDWAASTTAAMVNDNVLSAFGYNKGELVALDSAHAFSAIFQSQYGIRTGIISELWFAYGWLGLAAIGALGALVSALSAKCMRSTNNIQLLNRSLLLGLLASLIMGQSSTIAGSVTVLLYINISIAALRLFFSSPKSLSGQSAGNGV